MSQSEISQEGLTEKQRRILAYLRAETDGIGYFKSRLIGKQLGLSASEVGTNIRAVGTGRFGITVSYWGKSGGTTWEVTEATGPRE